MLLTEEKKNEKQGKILYPSAEMKQNFSNMDIFQRHAFSDK